MKEDICEALALWIRTGPHIESLDLGKRDPQGDYEDALSLAMDLYDGLIELGWTPPSTDAKERADG